ncbi:MAG: ribosomal-processing cysteine protease Prp [Clostridia bacterium]|nr:ribosomal-processing cysteine protease Prp [Clostridia bacterium]
MTRITVLYKNGAIVGFDAEGHTGYAEHGQDIVCAAVSAITQTAVNGITELLDCPCAADVSDGELHFMLDASVIAEQLEKAELLLKAMLLGLRSIEKEYSNYLKIKEREV